MEAAGLPVSVFLFFFFFFGMWKTVFNSTSLLIWGRRSAYHYTATFSLRSKCRLSVNTSTQPVSTVHVLCTSITTRTSRKFYYWIHRRIKRDHKYCTHSVPLLEAAAYFFSLTQRTELPLKEDSAWLRKALNHDFTVNHNPRVQKCTAHA